MREDVSLADALMDYLRYELERARDLEEFKQTFMRVWAAVKEKKIEELKKSLGII
ncbi:MAG: hypothetical protein J7L38_05610 [Thermoproteales archaeon]|nr:hypothetical protein [Thermoproteales archaeon]